jgi:hypothetical protein
VLIYLSSVLLTVFVCCCTSCVACARVREFCDAAPPSFEEDCRSCVHVGLQGDERAEFAGVLIGRNGSGHFRRE